MLEKFFDSSARGLARVRCLRNGPHGSLLDGFAVELFRLRYANITARRHLRSAEHFIHWTNHNRIFLPQWNSGALELFSRHLRRRPCLLMAVKNRLFLAMARVTARPIVLT